MERIERSGAIFPTESARKRGKGRRSRRAPALSNLHTHEVVRTQKLSLVRWARGTFGVGARFWCICTEYSSHFLRILRKYLFTNSFSPCYNHHNIQIEARASSVPDGIRSGSGRTGKGRPPKRRGAPELLAAGPAENIRRTVTKTTFVKRYVGKRIMGECIFSRSVVISRNACTERSAFCLPRRQ